MGLAGSTGVVNYTSVYIAHAMLDAAKDHLDTFKAELEAMNEADRLAAHETGMSDVQARLQELHAEIERLQAAREAFEATLDHRCTNSWAFDPEVAETHCPVLFVPTRPVGTAVSLLFNVPAAVQTQWRKTNRAFTSDFAKQVGAAIGVDPERIAIQTITVTGGQVKVVFEVLPPRASHPEDEDISAYDVKQKLQESIDDPNHNLHHPIAGGVIVSNQVPTTVDVRLYECADGTLREVCEPVYDDVDRTLPWVAGVVVAIIVVLICIALCVRNRKKAAPAVVAKDAEAGQVELAVVPSAAPQPSTSTMLHVNKPESATAIGASSDATATFQPGQRFTFTPKA